MMRVVSRFPFSGDRRAEVVGKMIRKPWYAIYERPSMQESIDYAHIDGVIALHGAKPSAVIAILQDIQERYRYLPRELFPHISRKIGVSEARIYSVATFYENFSLEPKGRYVLRVCDGTACHVRKSIPILERLRQELGLSEEKVTTDDLMFTLETVSCLGACGLAPVLTVNDTVHPAMTPEKTSDLIKELKGGQNVA